MLAQRLCMVKNLKITAELLSKMFNFHSHPNCKFPKTIYYEWKTFFCQSGELKRGILLKFYFSDTRKIEYLFKCLLAISIFFFRKFLLYSKMFSSGCLHISCGFLGALLWLILIFCCKYLFQSETCLLLIYSIFNLKKVLKDNFWVLSFA